MNSFDSTNQELTEEEMNNSPAQIGLVVAAVATGLAISFVMVRALEWNDNRKLKKLARTEA